MKKSFNTKEKALNHLEYRKKCAYERIQKHNDEVLGDASFVYKNEKNKWVVFIQIITKHMMNEIHAIQDIDTVDALIPFTSEEKVVKKDKRVKQLEKKYKTLDIEDYIK